VSRLLARTLEQLRTRMSDATSEDAPSQDGWPE